jgi:alpha-L-fucosidase
MNKSISPPGFILFLLIIGISSVSAQTSRDYNWPEWAESIGLNIPGPYVPTWESLDTHTLPEWYDDAKFGIFIHWRFAAEISAENWSTGNYNPLKWSEIIDNAGGRYSVLNLSPASTPESYKTRFISSGTAYGLFKAWASAVHERDIRVGVHNMHGYDMREFSFDEIIAINRDVRQVIDVTELDILWFDNEILPADYLKSKELIAFFYNRALAKGKEVAITDRGGSDAWGEHGDFYTPERVKYGWFSAHKWELCQTIGSSWGYNPRETEKDFKTIDYLVDELVDVVSKNGNYLLNIGPMPDGTIPMAMEERILGVGSWLKINGEAIYGTRPWKPYEENSIRFTQSKNGNTIYMSFLEWPEEKLVLVKTMQDIDIVNVNLFGFDEQTNWCQVREGLLITFPDQDKKPCENAWVFAMEIRNPGDREHKKELNLPDMRLDNVEISKNEIEAGEAFIISSKIRNNGNYSDFVKVELFIDNKFFAYTRVKIVENTDQKIEFSIRLYAAGKHELSLKLDEFVTVSSSLKVKAPEFPY